jgi:metal-responsive CopG/Arc/MetJ family transcriptional regulator
MTRKKGKVATGIVLDDYIVKDFDLFVESNRDLGLTRSETINAVLHSFLKSNKPQNEKTEKLREYIIKMRNGLLSLHFF